jgi:short subunit dehydrogenase-like uncharacterized protein
VSESTPLLIYGANGYTGRLVVAEAVRRGLRPIVAGRDGAAVAGVAREWALEHRVAALDDAPAVAAALAGVRVVLHCAGPFHITSDPMADACVRHGVHYLDITGEIVVFEALARRDAEARSRGVLLLPGVGFDVVPSDCLAVHVAARLPTANRLVIAIRGSGGVSRGTALTAVQNAGGGGAIRRGGRIVAVPTAWRTRAFHFGDGITGSAVTIPWGDVATAWHSTGIPDIEVYLAMPRSARRLLRLSRSAGWLLRRRAVRGLLQRVVRARGEGPSDRARAAGESRFRVEATDATGRAAASLLVAPEGYTLTARTAVAAARRVLAGGVAAGFQTPATAFGADFILEQDGVRRIDLDTPRERQPT